MPVALWKKLGYSSRIEWGLWLQCTYDDGYSQAKIATLANCHTTCIEDWFSKLNLRTRSLKEASHNTVPSGHLSSHEIEVLQGLLLSDGSISPGNCGARITYGFKHIEIVNSIPKKLCSLKFGPVWFSNKWKCWHQKSLTYKILAKIHNEWYLKGKKIVPRAIKLTPTMLYWWFIGNGYKASNSVILCTDSFPTKDVHWLANELCEIFYLDAVRTPRNRIRIRPGSVRLFYEIIGSSQHKCFDYKWKPRISKKYGVFTQEEIERNMSNKKIAVVTGVLGQTGSYLASELISEGYNVIGLARPRSGGLIKNNISSLKDDDRLELAEIDICDHTQISALISSVKPELFFNLAAQSHVHVSFDNPVETFRVNAEAVIAQLHAIKEFSPNTRYLQSSTSEMYGGTNCPEEGYNEDHSFHSRSPYGTSKIAGFYSVVNYREAYGLFACNSICFNHSSKRRGIMFATRKITKGLASVKLGLQEHLYMGDLSAFRDEGHAEDYAKAMCLMLQQDKPDDYVVATGETASIKQMFEYVCELAGLRFDNVYRLDERFCRPSDVPYLLGNPAKIKSLGWKPEYDWKSLLKEMYENDLALLGSTL